MLRAGLLAALILLLPLPGEALRLRREGEAAGSASYLLEAIAEDRESVEEALAQAADEIEEVAALFHGPDGGLARLNAAAGLGPRAVDPRLFAALERALSFCRWSEGRHGPLGGWLYAVWGLRTPVSALPGDDGLQRAVALAACDNLRLDPGAGTAELAASALVDLWGFAAGVMVDRAIDVLHAAGVRNATARVGSVQRGMGDGPDGRGWPLTVPLPSQLEQQHEQVRLQDDSVAVASTAAGRLRMGGVSFPPFLDQRTGRPGEGVAAVLAGTVLATDAEAIAASCFVLGNRRGTHLLAPLRPSPSVLWWLGDGQGEGLLTDFKWSRMTRPRRQQP